MEKWNREITQKRQTPAQTHIHRCTDLYGLKHYCDGQCLEIHLEIIAPFLPHVLIPWEYHAIVSANCKYRLIKYRSETSSDLDYNEESKIFRNKMSIFIEIIAENDMHWYVQCTLQQHIQHARTQIERAKSESFQVKSTASYSTSRCVAKSISIQYLLNLQSQHNMCSSSMQQH